MTLITRLRKLEGIGMDAVRAELVQLIHQSLKDSEQDLEVITVSGCDTISANTSHRIAITDTYRRPAHWGPKDGTDIKIA